MDVARDLPGGHVRAALRLQRATGAVVFAGAKSQRHSFVNPACGAKHLAVGAGVHVGAAIPFEVRTREGAVFAFALVPHGNVRRDPLLLDEPAEELAGAVGRIGDQPLRLQIEAPCGSIDHCLHAGAVVGRIPRRNELVVARMALAASRPSLIPAIVAVASVHAEYVAHEQGSSEISSQSWVQDGESPSRTIRQDPRRRSARESYFGPRPA